MEFTLVRDFVRDALLEVCSQVKLDTEKSVLKQAAVQHLYGRLSGTLKPHANDAQLLVGTLLTFCSSYIQQHQLHPYMANSNTTGCNRSVTHAALVHSISTWLMVTSFFQHLSLTTVKVHCRLSSIARP